jgi:hypothetical protein
MHSFRFMAAIPHPERHVPSGGGKQRLGVTIAWTNLFCIQSQPIL